jgi:putative copper export protein
MTAVDLGLRLSGYVALAIFLGGLTFLTLLWPAGSLERRTRRLLVGSCLLGLVTSIASIGVKGAYAKLLPVSAAVRPDVFGPMLEQPAGRVYAAKALLWVLAIVVLVSVLQRDQRVVRKHSWRIGALAVAFGLLGTTAMTSHAAASPAPSMTTAADILHLAGMSTWVGGLVVLSLGLLPRREPDELATVVPLYSKFALGSVIAISVGGAILAWQLVGSVDAFLNTSFGRTLLVKIVIFGVVLAVAMRSRSWVISKLPFAVVLRGHEATVRPFVYSVAAETVLLLGALGAASLLVAAIPGR